MGDTVRNECVLHNCHLRPHRQNLIKDTLVKLEEWEIRTNLKGTAYRINECCKEYQCSTAIEAASVKLQIVKILPVIAPKTAVPTIPEIGTDRFWRSLCSPRMIRIVVCLI